MYLTVINIVVKLPFLMIHYMVDAAKHSKSTFPLSIMHTWIFPYFGVDLSYEPVETPQEIHIYHIRSCVKMGYSMDGNIQAYIKMDDAG